MTRKRKPKSRGKVRRASRGFSQQVLLVLTGSALTLCALSIMYGFLIRQSMAKHEPGDLRIEVLNGTGEQGIAHSVALSLRKMGVDVLNEDNAKSFDFEESILIERKDNDGVKALGKAIGCRNVIVQLKDDSIVDATLIIGADYHKLNLDE
jgi:hypothetical protein